MHNAAGGLKVATGKRISKIQIRGIHNDERKDPHPKNKLRTFRKFKLTYDYENYLTNVRNINHRVAITKLRLSNHKLAIETGRYVKPFQPPDQRSVHYVKLE